VSEMAEQGEQIILWPELGPAETDGDEE